ncbi:hypothetical protein I6M42_22200 [Shewanella algae]|uniref:phosphoribosyltransferase-like protein n=1 Tax=Shewanella algae TaxID=38313 RepID=UPI001AAECFA0|nr:hypothetical protein [Shewanella algae]MBO2639338.1 hypothetical protein [Shewanella algae]
MKIPENHEAVYEDAVDVAKKLIRFNYWDRLEISDLEAWLDNFDTKEEKFISSAILMSIVYRNVKSIRTFGANIIQIKLPKLLEEHDIYQVDSIKSWENDLKFGAKHKVPIRFSAIEGMDGKPGKSGSTIYREICNKYFNKSFGVFCSDVTDRINSDRNFKALVLFDDILGTGTQFNTYVSKFDIDNLGIKVFYFPFAGLKDSIDKIHSKYKNIIVSPVETLTEEDSLFSDSKYNFFNKFNNYNNCEVIKNFYLEMCNKNDIKTKELLGFGELALTYIFNNSVPNNNIAALWYDSETWTQLVGR